jgi:glycosyltransferase involved in cell wall biosynthesis
MNKSITVVIPCKNEGEPVVDIIKLVLTNNPEVSVIVADSSDDGSTPLLLQGYSKLHPTRIKIVEGGLPSIARNNGAKLVKTPYILFLDADIYIQPTTISECLKEAMTKNLDLITCKLTTDKPFRWVYSIFNIVQQITSLSRPFAVGGFMLFKTETFNQLGGFNEKDKIAEDYHLSSKIKPSKFKVANHTIYTPSRRFRKKGVWYMIKLMVHCWINRNDETFYQKDHNYWI